MAKRDTVELGELVAEPSLPITPEAPVVTEPPLGVELAVVVQEPKPAPEKPGPELKTPEEHAVDTRNAQSVQEPFKLGGGLPGTLPLFSWQHAAAAQLHGWNQHKLDSAEPFLLSRADYEAALAAVENPSPQGEYTPHPAACSPFLKRGN